MRDRDSSIWQQNRIEISTEITARCRSRILTQRVFFPAPRRRRSIVQFEQNAAFYGLQITQCRGKNYGLQLSLQLGLDRLPRCRC